MEKGSDPVKLIAECCSQHKDLILPDLPLLELVFRILLANSNQPISLSQLSQRIQEILVRAGNHRSASPDTLKRIIDNNTYYNIRRTDLSSSGKGV